MSPRAWLLVYAATVVAATFLHHAGWLTAALLCAVIASGEQRWRLLGRTVRSLLVFNLTISLGYLAVTAWRGGFSPDYLVLVNLRVLLLVYLGFWFAARVNLLAALRGWPLLTLLTTLALGQMQTFARIVRDFRLAFESRNPMRPHLTDRARNAAAQATTLFDKSLASTTEVTQAMRSRGAFDD